jgi:integrase
MAVLRKRKIRKGYVYDVDFSYKGKRRVISTKTDDFTVAKRILGEVQGLIACGKFDLVAEKKKEINLKKYFDQYFNNVKDIKAKSTLELEKIYTKRFVDIVGDRPLRSIDFNTLDHWREQFCSVVSPTTFNIVVRTLRAIFNRAKKRGYIDNNPFDDIEKIRVNEKRLFLLKNELERLFEQIDKDLNRSGLRENVLNFRRRFRLYVEFLLHTGLRRDEALRLKQSDVDYNQNVIYVEKTKTKQMRAIPLTKRAKEILLELGEGLFHKLNKHDVTNKFREYLNRAGLKGFKLHSLRHTFACQLVVSGIDIYAISRLLGHTDLKTTMIYAKVNIESLKPAVEKLDHSYLNLLVKNN